MSRPAALRITTGQIETLVSHARAEAPCECCGVIGLHNDRVEAIFAASNVAASPSRYEADPCDLLEIYASIETRALSPGGVYHSHPRGPAYPSEIDIENALHPDAIHWIVSPAGPHDARVRAFRIVDREVVEIPLLSEA